MMGEDRKIPPPKERKAMLERRATLKTTSIAVVALFATCLIATSAHAHPTLKSANPPVDGTAAAAPTEIRMSFSGDLEVLQRGIAGPERNKDRNRKGRDRREG